MGCVSSGAGAVSGLAQGLAAFVALGTEVEDAVDTVRGVLGLDELIDKRLVLGTWH